MARFFYGCESPCTFVTLIWTCVYELYYRYCYCFSHYIIYKNTHCCRDPFLPYDGALQITRYHLLDMSSNTDHTLEFYGQLSCVLLGTRCVESVADNIVHPITETCMCFSCLACLYILFFCDAYIFVWLQNLFHVSSNNIQPYCHC